jgi:hypothetical protein
MLKHGNGQHGLVDLDDDSDPAHLLLVSLASGNSQLTAVPRPLGHGLRANAHLSAEEARSRGTLHGPVESKHRDGVDVEGAARDQVFRRDDSAAIVLPQHAVGPYITSFVITTWTQFLP